MFASIRVNFGAFDAHQQAANGKAPLEAEVDDDYEGKKSVDTHTRVPPLH
jgi:hypothetical protein